MNLREVLVKKNQILGGLLLVVAIIVLTGQFVDLGGDWWDVDYLTIVVCGVSGAMLLRGEHQR